MRMYSFASTSFFKSRWATIMSIPVAFTNCATLISLMYPKCTMNLSVRLLAVWQAPHWQTVSRSITMSRW